MQVRLILLATVLGAAPDSAFAAKITRGPYLQKATPTSVVVVWRTDERIDPIVRFGSTPDTLDRTVKSNSIQTRVSTDVAAELAVPYGSEPLLYDEPLGSQSGRNAGDRDPSTEPGTYQYEATIGGLEPNSQWFYAVNDGEQRLAGGDSEHSFVTSPNATSPVDVRLWVVGDSGTGGADQRRVFESMEAFAERTSRRPDAFIHVGDMAYGDGADVEFQQNFFDVYQSLLRNTVCWPAMGNHEGHTSRGVSQFGPYYDAYVLPTAGEAGGAASGTEAYYSFDLGRAHFVCLDSHDLDRTPDGAMTQWLVMDLEQTDADWLIAFWHHPPYTKGSHDSDHELQLIEMRTYIMPLLESAGVDLVLSGHSHIYERSMLIDGAYATPTVADGVVLNDGDGRPEGDGAYLKSEGLTPNNGTVAIVAGHGGAGVTRKGTMPIMREIIVENGSLILDVEDDTLNGTMINKQGETRDTFQIVKRGKVQNAPIDNPWQPKHDPLAITETPIVWNEKDAGASPADWTIVTGRSEQMMVERRPGTPFFQAAVRPEGEPFRAVFDGFDDRTSEVEAWIEVGGDSPTPGGLILGWKGPNDYYCFELDASRGVAALMRIRGDERRLLAERTIDIDFSKPIKVELEPVERIIEVQLNDDLEYTINLDRGLPGGRIGVESLGGALNVAGVTIERAR